MNAKTFFIFPEGYSPVVAQCNHDNDPDYEPWTYEDSRKMNELSLKGETIQIEPDDEGEYRTPIGKWGFEGDKEKLTEDIKKSYELNNWPMEDFEKMVKGEPACKYPRLLAAIKHVAIYHPVKYVTFNLAGTWCYQDSQGNPFVFKEVDTSILEDVDYDNLLYPSCFVYEDGKLIELFL